MPNFTCTSCGASVSYARGDVEYFKDRGWRCGFCLRVISEGCYSKDIGGTTVFLPIGSKKMGEALGDRTLFEVVKRNYIAGNPSERVVFLKPEDDLLWAIDDLKPKKIFMSEFPHEQMYDVLQSHKVIRYNALNDVCAFAKMRDYPVLEYDPVKPNISIPEKYAVVHIRNIEKEPLRPHPKRNADPNLITDIFHLLFEQEFNIFLVGNDHVDDCWNLHELVHDYRNKLSLPEIAWLMKDHLFIGRDSGMVHVAAASGAHIVAWAFITNKWLPKTPVPFVAFMDGASDKEILEGVKQLMNCGISGIGK